MRSDAIGLFWQDIPRRGKDRIARVMPPIPDTGWKTPQEFPNLSAARALTIDVETKDPELKKHGPGWARGVGHLCGIAVGVPEGRRWYFPMRHEVEPEYNLEPSHVIKWAQDNLTRAEQPKIGANLIYDVGWLREEGVFVRGDLFDVQLAEALLQERGLVNLDALAARHLGLGKVGEQLYDWCCNYYGGKPTQQQRENIYRAPPRLVGPYAEGDVDLPFHIIAKQWPLLYNTGLLDVFLMECRLIYLLVEMRYAGVTVDLDRAEKLRKELKGTIDEIDKQIKALVGFGVNTNANASMAQACDVLGIRYPYTDKGTPSFTKTFLEEVDHPFAELVIKRRQRAKLIGTFLEGYILDAHINGKVYGQFHQLRGDSKGARSGRFSSSTPNLQNIPIRSKLGKRMRRIFVPDPGHAHWRKNDYSQIEYRGLAHYAVGPRSEELRARYNDDPNVDFHVMVQTIIQEVIGLELERPLVKNINFGTAYGMGQKKLRRYLHLSDAEAKELMEAIHGAAPFLKATMQATMDEADQYGFITTILGRRSYFDEYVPGAYDKNAKPLPFHRAVVTYLNPKRAYLHKALNRRLQGSAADLMKMAMVQCWEAGVFDETGVPRLTVHDELDFSDPGGKDEAFREMLHIMETCVRFRVPVKAGNEIGPSWGEVEEVAA